MFSLRRNVFAVLLVVSIAGIYAPPAGAELADTVDGTEAYEIAEENTIDGSEAYEVAEERGEASYKASSWAEEWAEECSRSTPWTYRCTIELWDESQDCKQSFNVKSDMRTGELSIGDVSRWQCKQTS